MPVYFQHVGEAGGNRDFPRTIGTPQSGLRRFGFGEIAPHLTNLPPDEVERLANDTERYAPDGFQVRGIPSGARGSEAISGWRLFTPAESCWAGREFCLCWTCNRETIARVFRP